MAHTIALAGNPNSGKTSLFNELTGSTQYVGNWPGVTVEKKEGHLKHDKRYLIVDLPGIYSLSPYTLEEVVTRDYLLDGRPDLIIDVVDSTNLERNLYLTTQLIETGIPVVIALNMMDITEKRGDVIDVLALSHSLGCPVVPTSAVTRDGLKELVRVALQMIEKAQSVAKTATFSKPVEYALGKIGAFLEGNVPPETLRWYAIKLFERDGKVLARLNLGETRLQEIETIILQVESETDDASEGLVTNDRYEYLSAITMRTHRQAKKKGNLSASDRIDRVVTNRWLALPLFFLLMWGIYYIAIQSVGDLFIGWIEWLFVDLIGANVALGLSMIGTSPWLTGLVVDGIIAGVGSVLTFVPQMMILFFFLSLMEDCGYMARVAFIMDRIFRKFGLSGKSFIPMLIGTGCSVPAIMASRTIENQRDRRMTVMLTPFIPCGAKLPVFALLVGAFFPNSAWIASSMYLVGIIAVILSGIVLKKTKAFAGDPAPFVMELPAYHMPRMKGVFIHMWERGKQFIKKAGTIIAVASAAIWILQSTSWSFQLVETQQSILASLGRLIAPLFVPLGFGTWEVAVATITGLLAKETIVATFGIVLGLGNVAEGDPNLLASIGTFFTPVSAYAFMVFTLFAAPCAAAIGATRREMQSARWTWAAILFQTGIAYAAALLVYQIGSLIF
ncbi:MAG: ferrous iron transport protein B [Sphaerochaetaceae bacterium]|jgi:ferrous iron transport protein B|nr:ferrous iron transport protein B [Sphaerochaetaceae bacterium]